MIKTESWLQHLTDETERIVMRSILDKMNLTANKGVWTHTSFLNPEQIKGLESILIAYQEELVCRTHLLFEDGEYTMLSFSALGDEDMETCPFSVLQLIYPKQFAELAHRDVLGTLMSLGLKRESIGDIRVLPGECYVAVTREMSGYVENNLTDIKRVGVRVKEISLDQVPLIETAFQLMSYTIASLRLDALVAAVTKLSREKAKGYITSQKVKLNYAVCDDPSAQIAKGDLLSIRGFGRFMIDDLLGETKKNRVCIQVKKTKT